MIPRPSVFTFINRILNQQEGSAQFFYTIQTENTMYSFTHTLLFPTKNVDWKSIPKSLLETILNNLHLMLGISYWKLFCSNTIITPHIQLTVEQASFWDTIYTKGLGEFFYKNQIDYRGLIHFPAFLKKVEKPISFPRVVRSLLLFGGGKDSIVSVELLKKSNKEFSLFMIGESDVQKRTAGLISADRLIFQNILDPQIFAMNVLPGTYNGHIPISAVWAFISLFAAILHNYSFVITSNEQSANFGNVDYLGNEMNHQWSKSFEFETMFSAYMHEWITPSVSYFSLLRPLQELHIMQLFTKFSNYFSSFSSCNRNFKIQGKLQGKLWCGECPKCLFVFIMMAAFLPKNELILLFGKNLLIDPLLLPLGKELLGIDAFKPFECVGTPDETKLALWYIHKTGDYEDSAVVQLFVKDILPTINIDSLKTSIFSVDHDHQIPQSFASIIQGL